jgi:hypothetical protein
MYVNFAERRRRKVSHGGGAATPPTNTAAPVLVLLDQNTLSYSSGAWSGTNPITVVARLFVDNVDVGPATPTMAIQEAWRRKACGIREAATNVAGGPIYALSQEVIAPLPLNDQIQAMLAGTSGFVYDPYDYNTLSLIHNGVDPISGPGDLIGRILSKFGSGPQRQSFQSAAAGRPILQTDRTLLLDGVDDSLGSSSQNFMANNVPAVSLFFRIISAATVLSGYHSVVFAQTAESTGNQNERIGLHIQDGKLVATCRRPDTAAPVILTSPSDLVANGDYTIGADFDFAGASPLARLWINNAVVASIAIPGTPENTSTGNNLRTGLGVRHTTPGKFAGRYGRLFYATQVLTDPQRATVDAWLKEVP